MNKLQRGDVLVCRRNGSRVMIRRVDPAPRRPARGQYPGRMVVLWSMAHDVQLAGRYTETYLLDRLADGTMRKLARRRDAAAVIHEAAARNRRGMLKG